MLGPGGPLFQGNRVDYIQHRQCTCQHCRSPIQEAQPVWRVIHKPRGYTAAQLRSLRRRLFNFRGEPAR